MEEVSVGDIVRQYHTAARLRWDDAEVLEVAPWGGITVRDLKNGTVYGWSTRMCEVVSRAAAIRNAETQKDPSIPRGTEG